MKFMKFFDNLLAKWVARDRSLEIYDVLSRVRSLTEYDLAQKTQYELLSSLTEEVGELSRAMKIEDGVFGNTYKNAPDEPSSHEAADVVIAALAMYFARGGLIKDLAFICEEKLDKWEKSSTLESNSLPPS